MPIAPVVGAALIGGGAALAGGVIASKASSKAAKAQENAANTAAAAQERAAALALEAQKTGNAEAVAAAREAAAAAQTAQDAATKAAQDCSRAQYEETKGEFGQGFDAAQGAYDQAYQRQAGFQQPYIQSGLTAQNQIMQLMGLGGDTTAADYGQYAKQFGTAQFEQDPGYAFRQSEGMKALERSASARGGLLSGGALKGIQRFGQDLASQEFGNAFNRYQTERAARLGTLGGLSSAGQSASNNMSNFAGVYGGQTAGNALDRANAMAGNAANYYGTQSNLALGQGQNTAQNQYNIADAVSRGAQNIGNAASQSAYNVGNAQAQGALGAGQARASGYIGQSNAYNNALGQIAGMAMQAPMNNAMMAYYRNNTPPPPSSGSTTPYFAAGQGPLKAPTAWGY